MKCPAHRTRRQHSAARRSSNPTTTAPANFLSNGTYYLPTKARSRLLQIAPQGPNVFLITHVPTKPIPGSRYFPRRMGALVHSVDSTGHCWLFTLLSSSTLRFSSLASLGPEWNHLGTPDVLATIPRRSGPVKFNNNRPTRRCLGCSKPLSLSPAPAYCQLCSNSTGFRRVSSPPGWHSPEAFQAPSEKPLLGDAVPVSVVRTRQDNNPRLLP